MSQQQQDEPRDEGSREDRPGPQGEGGEEREERLLAAYDRMLHRVRERLAGGKGSPEALREALEAARREAVRRGEVDEAESHRLAGFLQRDLAEISRQLREEGRELKDWLLLDLQLVEEELLDLLAQVADPTELAWFQLAERARLAEAGLTLYRTGEIATVGTFQCVACGERVHLHRTGRLPPCPRCHGTEFVRVGRRRQGGGA